MKLCFIIFGFLLDLGIISEFKSSFTEARCGCISPRRALTTMGVCGACSRATCVTIARQVCPPNC